MVTLNLDGSKDELFIDYNKEDNAKEKIGEVDQTANGENQQSVEIKIMKEETDNPLYIIF